MAKLIGLSGPQGGGKSTLLKGLEERGVVVDDFKVSRQVQKELGWESLANVLESPKTMMAFQAKIRDVKYVRELENKARTDVDIILTERSFADIATYTQLWSWELADSGKWEVEDAVQFLVDYTDRCRENQLVYSGNIYLPSMPHVAWQADPHRAQQQHIEFVSKQLEAFFELAHPRSIPVFKVTEGSVSGRVEQVYEWIKSL